MSHFLYSLLLVLSYLALSRKTSLRIVLWGGVMVVLTVVHFLHHTSPPIVRMFVLCWSLLICMKGLILAEWGGKLGFARWICFTFLWFGMDPAPFVGKRRSLTWRRDAGIGFACLCVGLMFSVAVAHWSSPSILAMFIPLSLAFHFGCLRLLVAFWRWQGITVRPLFRNPLCSRGLADFWSVRWNLSYSQMMVRAVARPLTPKLGKRGTHYAVFLISGLLHELAITLPVQHGYGLPTLYFSLHAGAVELENECWPLWIRRGYAWFCITVPLPILFPPVFTDEVIRGILSYLVIF